MSHGPRLACLVLVAALAAAGCRGRGRAERQEPMSRRPIAQVLVQHTPRLMALPGVVGTYEGESEDGAPCLRVMVVALNPALRESIPAELEGWPVEIEETGEIRPLDAPGP